MQPQEEISSLPLVVISFTKILKNRRDAHLFNVSPAKLCSLLSSKEMSTFGILYSSKQVLW